MAFKTCSVAFDAHAEDKILRPGGARLRLKSVEKMNDVGVASALIPRNRLKLLIAMYATAFDYSFPFELWSQAISNTKMTIECRKRIIGLVFGILVLWLEDLPALRESHSIDLADNRKGK
jgi:hypothetical protein